ncbi:MAG: C45 family peptidase [Clostridia bacterium]
MQYFRSAGTSYQIGFLHGQHFKTEIQRAYLQHCNFEMETARLKEICYDIKVKMEHLLPYAVDELRGIAEGSGMEFDQALMLNNWEEIVQLCGESKHSCCTSITFRGTDFGTILGKTTDIEPFQVADYFLSEIEPDAGYHSLFLGKIGTLKCEAGINEKGLCIGSNSAIEKNKQIGDLERMTLLHYVLQNCDSIDAAIAFLQEHRFYRLGLNVTLIDRSGRAVVAECGNTHMAQREIQDLVGYATNHYVIPEMAAKYDYDIWYYQNSLERFQLLQQKLSDCGTPRTIDDMMRLIQSHEESGSICNHSSCCETMYATIWVPELLSVWVCDGRPCESAFQQWKMS